MSKIVIFIVLLAGLASGMKKKTNLVTGDDDLWMPDLRSIRLGPPGATAAEFVVGSGVGEQDQLPNPNRRVGSIIGDDEDRFQMLPQPNADKVREFDPCLDASAATVLHLHERDGYSGGLLVLRQSTPRMGAAGFPTSSAVVRAAIPGSRRRRDACCWELFDRAGFSGRMLRLCQGIYSRDVLRATISAAVKSARMVANPKKKYRSARLMEHERLNELTPQEALFGAWFNHIARRL